MEEDGYRSFYENAIEGLFQTTPGGRFQRMNPSFAAMFGYGSPQEMMGSISDIGQQLYVEPRRRQEVLGLLNERGKVEGYEVELIRKDGSRLWGSLNVRAVFDASGALMDIAACKRAEEKYYKVFMTAPDCIAIAKMSNGLIMETNQGFEEITGWSRSEAVGKTSLEIHFWVDPADRDSMVRDLQSKREIRHREFRFGRKDGSVRHGIYSARSIQIANEECLIFVLQDTTEHKLLEEERKKLDAIGQLAGGVAHDFNNMLSVIIGNLEMAMERVAPTEPLHKPLKEILNAAIRSADLTRQLLAFARKQTAIPKVLDINEEVTGTMRML